MCGIAGYILNVESINHADILHDMTNAIAYRGPDDRGFYEVVTCDQRFRIGLGHRRLSIIDLEKGHQPISNEDGSVKIVSNGEIYNFKELRKRLSKHGHRFVTNSDTEVIIHAYEEFGVNCVDHLRGMFAFAIWDAKNERFLLARDRFGEKPLFICQNNGNLFFASEIKALLACPGINAEVDKQSVWHYLAYRYVPGPATFFLGIYKLPPASITVWEKGELKQNSYYSPPDRYACSDYLLLSKPVDLFLNKLQESVAIRMISDVPFGAFLSGGIDSSAVVALMSKYSNLPVKTFSVGFKEQRYSELNYAAMISREFNTDHHELIVSQDNLMDELEKLIAFRDSPVSEPSDIAIYLLSKEARRTVKMVLTGEGSDEILGGYPKHTFERFAHYFQIIPDMIFNKLMEPLIYSLPYRFRRVKTAITSLSLLKREERFPRWFGALSPKEREKLVSIVFSVREGEAEVQFLTEPNNSPLRKILYFDQTSWLPDNLLERGDRMTMAVSLEARMPFMDHELAELVSALPDKYRVRGFQTKWILRQAMKKILPTTILARSKVGFRIPVNEWFHGPMRDYLYDNLTGPGSITKVYYHTKELKKVLEEHVNGKQNHEKLLWTILTLEIWHRQYKVQP